MDRIFENVLRAMIERSLINMLKDRDYILWNVQEINFADPQFYAIDRVRFDYDVIVVDVVTDGVFELCGCGYADGYGVHVPDTAYNTYRVKSIRR